MSGNRARKERLREERLAHERAGAERRGRRRRLGLGGAAAALVAAGLATAAIVSGGSDSGSPGSPSPSSGAQAGGGDATSPRAPGQAPDRSRNGRQALAANRAQANQLIDGGEEALDEKLAELRGHPVVVNQWGSWCPPCRAEFPFFAESAEAHAAEVAFLGVDIQDDRDAAEDFLEELPVPYPHIFDPDADAVFSLGWTQSSPTTWFIDERGEIVHQRPGAYPNRDALEADLQASLLSG